MTINPLLERLQEATPKVLAMIGGAGVLIVSGIILLLSWLWSGPSGPIMQLREYGDHHHHHDQDHHHDHSHHHGHDVRATAENYKQVLKTINAQLKADPNNKQLRGTKVHIGMAFEPAVAIRECEKILLENPKDYFALTHLAHAYYGKDEMERAIYFATAALTHHETEGLLVLLGHAHFQRRAFSLARKMYQRALALKPGSEAARLGLSRAEAQLDGLK